MRIHIHTDGCRCGLDRERRRDQSPRRQQLVAALILHCRRVQVDGIVGLTESVTNNELTTLIDDLIAAISGELDTGHIDRSVREAVAAVLGQAASRLVTDEIDDIQKRAFALNGEGK